jgi:type IV secretory pathway TraG/TraD family ATPase VirD4
MVAAAALLLHVPVALAAATVAGVAAWGVSKQQRASRGRARTPIATRTPIAARAPTGTRASTGAQAHTGAAPDPIPLGAGMDGRPVTLTEQQLAAHALILGASGAGKTTTLLAVLRHQIQQGRPVIAIDLKGSPAFVADVRLAAAQSERPVTVWTPDGPSTWNPLAHGNATELKDKLICTERFTEPHYQRAAERYVQTALQVLLARDPDRAPTLAEVVDLMDPKRLAGAARSLAEPLAFRIQDYVFSLGPDQLSAVRGLATRLAIIGESHTGAFLGDPPRGPDRGGGTAVDLRAALAGEQVVVFSLNSSSYGQMAAQLGTLAVQDLVTAVGHRLAAGGGPQALIAIDEFSALGADNVIALLARGREAGASVMLATQELADLDRAARGLRDQVLGNTAVKIAHRQDVPSSARTVAEMVGTRRVWEETRHTQSGLLRGLRDTGRGTRRLVERDVIEPDVIKRLATGEAVVITKVPRAAAGRVRIAPPPAQDGTTRGL